MEYLTSFITFLLVAGLALLFLLMMCRTRERTKELAKMSEETAATLEAHLHTSRARVLEAVVAKLPEIADTPSLGTSIDTILTMVGTPLNNHHQNIEQSNDHTSWNSNESLVDQSYQQALAQARTQFWLSVTAVTIGVIWLLLVENPLDVNAGKFIVTILPGTILIGGALLGFHQTAVTREQAGKRYEFRIAQHHQQTLALIDTIEDSSVRSAVKAQLVLAMVGLTLYPLDLNICLSVED